MDKKLYFAPEMEIVELKLNTALLAGSPLDENQDPEIGEGGSTSTPDDLV